MRVRANGRHCAHFRLEFQESPPENLCEWLGRSSLVYLYAHCSIWEIDFQRLLLTSFVWVETRNTQSKDIFPSISYYARLLMYNEHWKIKR